MDTGERIFIMKTHLEEYWLEGLDTRVCGYIMHPKRGFLQGLALAEYFYEQSEFEDLKAALKNANGCFAIVLNRGGYSIAAVDKYRSYPLFYDAAGNLADKSEKLQPWGLKELKASDPQILAEFLITGYCTGADTLHAGIKQIPAGHYLLTEAGHKPRLERYYSYGHQEDKGFKPQDAMAHLHEIHLKVMEDFLNSLNGRALVIPLSGGYDSRLIAFFAKKLNYENVITFSYDSRQSAESRISKQVADFLKLPWIFVEHTHKNWYEAYHSPARRDFYRYAVNASSSAHIQDWLAVQEMKSKKLIPHDAVFMPGHGGDFLQSGDLSAAFARRSSFKKEELYHEILAKHHRLWPLDSEKYRSIFENRLHTQLSAPDLMSVQEAAALFKSWDFQERQGKFILNSLRVYEYYGYQWRLPLFDQRLMDFWAQVPVRLLVGRSFWQLYYAKYSRIPAPVFRYPAFTDRVIDKLLRIKYGEVRNVRYGRFAPRHSTRQYASEKVKSYLNQAVRYPEFVNKDLALIRSDMNALQALKAIQELK